MPGWLSGWVSAFGSGHDPGIWDQVSHWASYREPSSLFLSFFILFIYSWETQRERQRHRLLTESPMPDSVLDPGIMPWAKGRRSTSEPPRAPKKLLFFFSSLILKTVLHITHLQSPTTMFNFLKMCPRYWWCVIHTTVVCCCYWGHIKD